MGLMDANAFVNPHSREFEYVIATITLQKEYNTTKSNKNREASYQSYTDMQNINNQSTSQNSFARISPNQLVNLEEWSNTNSTEYNNPQPQLINPLGYIPIPDQSNQHQQWTSQTFNIAAGSLPEFSNVTTSEAGIIWPVQHEFL
jgi:hypothetical protein